MNKKPNFVPLEHEEATFYLGYCIKYTGNYEKLLAQLNSERMEEFVRISSRNFRDAWKAYSNKVIQDFMIDTKVLEEEKHSTDFEKVILPVQTISTTGIFV